MERVGEASIRIVLVKSPMIGRGIRDLAPWVNIRALGKSAVRETIFSTAAYTLSPPIRESRIEGIDLQGYQFCRSAS